MHLRITIFDTEASIKEMNNKLTGSARTVNSPHKTGNLHTFKNMGNKTF